MSGPRSCTRAQGERAAGLAGLAGGGSSCAAATRPPSSETSQNHRLPYYWNQRTGETTAIGEPKPGASGRLTVYRMKTRQPLAASTGGGGGGGGLVGTLAMGAGVGLVFALLSRVI